jgi:hypothetical protein
LLILKEKRLVSFLLSLSSLLLSLFSSVTVLSFGNTNFFCSLTSILIFLLFDSFLTVVFLILSLVEILMVFSIIFISEFSTLLASLLISLFSSFGSSSLMPANCSNS